MKMYQIKQENQEVEIQKDNGKEEFYFCQYCSPQNKLTFLDFIVNHKWENKSSSYFWQCLDSKWEKVKEGIWKKGWKDEMKIVGENLVESFKEISQKIQSTILEFQAKQSVKEIAPNFNKLEPKLEKNDGYEAYNLTEVFHSTTHYE